MGVMYKSEVVVVISWGGMQITKLSGSTPESVDPSGSAYTSPLSI